MTEVKEKKRPMGLLVWVVLTIISQLIYQAVYYYVYDATFSITWVFQLLSLFVLLLYTVVPKMNKKFILLIYILSRIVIAFSGYLNQSAEQIIIGFFLTVMPFVFIIIGLIKSNKIIECVGFVYYGLLFVLFCISLIGQLSLNGDIFYVCLASNVSGIIFWVAHFWLWYTQIAKHIGFKEKIKFDYKPIQKKVAVTETTLEELKLMYDNGTITEQEYNHKKSEIINKL